MNSKWIKLNWTRTLKYPKIWRIFKARDLNSDKLVEYRVEDMPEARYDDAIDHMKAFYLKDEPVSEALDACNDAQYVADYEFVGRSILQQKSSLVCFCSDKIVGVSTHYVVTKADNFGKQAYERCRSPKTKKMYDVDSVLTKNFNVFEQFGVFEYLYLHNLAVDSRFRGLNIGLQMLDVSFDEINKLHPELGIKNIKSKQLSLKSFLL